MQQIQVQPPKRPGDPLVVTQVTQVMTGVPQTAQELRGLRQKRGELSDQLVSASNRRKNLADQLLSADPASRPGLEARMKVLDARIVRLESEIDRTGDLLANAPPHLLSGSTVDPEILLNKLSDDLVPITGILSVFVILPFTLAVSRFIWKRGSNFGRAAVTDPATQRRLEQMQQSIDTIALEIERISEGQRYVTKMMSDGRAIGSGAAEPVRAPKMTAVSSDRG